VEIPAVEPALNDGEVARIFLEATGSQRFPTKRAAIKAVADRLRLPVKSVYAALERAKN
jgi:hypothetical protein